MNLEDGITSLLPPFPSHNKCPFSTCRASHGKTWLDIFSWALWLPVASGAGAGQQEEREEQGQEKTEGIGSEVWTYAEPKMTLAQRGQGIVSRPHSTPHTAVWKGALRAACPTLLQEQEAPDASGTFAYLYNNRSAGPCARNTQPPQADCPRVVSGLLDPLQQQGAHYHSSA